MTAAPHSNLDGTLIGIGDHADNIVHGSWFQYRNGRACNVPTIVSCELFSLAFAKKDFAVHSREFAKRWNA
jgi:hypothetical protein